MSQSRDSAVSGMSAGYGCRPACRSHASLSQGPGRPSSILQIFTVTLTLSLLPLLALVPPTAARGTSGFYADVGVHGAQQTVLLNRLPVERRRAVKREILALLGLPHRPRPTDHGTANSAPSYMLDLYETLNDDGNARGPGPRRHRVADEVPRMVRQRIATQNLTLPGMEDYAGVADMIASFLNHGEKGHRRLRHDHNRALYFDLSEVPPEMSVTGAELRIYKRLVHNHSHGNASVTIEIYRLYEESRRRNHNSDQQPVLEASVTVSGTHNGWVDINVTAAAYQWNFFPRTNRGLRMVVKNAQGVQVAPSDAGVVDVRGPADKQAFLVAFFKATQQVRSRRPRGAGRRSQKTEVTFNDDPGPGGWGASVSRLNTVCKRRQLYVSFEDLGWEDWIIAPNGYSAFYCSGECSFPLNVHMNATNHAIVQTLVHLLRPFQAPKPSCAPTELSPISVLFFDDNSNVILMKYRNMVVTACGCH